MRTKQEQKQKPKSKEKASRMMCTVCMKPNAVRYYIIDKNKGGTAKRLLVYEHRDEPPIKTYEYENHGKIHSYRRCFAGAVTNEPLMPNLDEDVTAVRQSDSGNKMLPNKTEAKHKEKQEIANGKDYKKMYLDEKKKNDALKDAVKQLIRGLIEYV